MIASMDISAAIERFHTGAMKMVTACLYTAFILTTHDAAMATEADGILTASSVSTSIITNDALSNMNGFVRVNQATGDGNMQANSHAISISNDTGIATARIISEQTGRFDMKNTPSVSISRISGNAFTNTKGVVSINQSAGVGNMQVNAFALSGSIKGEMTDEMLSGTLAGASAMSGEFGLRSNTQRVAHVDKTVFIGSSGVVQLNQAAGSGNMTRNRFEMSFNPNH